MRMLIEDTADDRFDEEKSPRLEIGGDSLHIIGEYLIVRIEGIDDFGRAFAEALIKEEEFKPDTSK